MQKIERLINTHLDSILQVEDTIERNKTSLILIASPKDENTDDKEPNHSHCNMIFKRIEYADKNYIPKYEWQYLQITFYLVEYNRTKADSSCEELKKKIQKLLQKL